MFFQVMRLERGMCYGSCPVYNLTVMSDGTVVYEGISYVKHEGVHVYLLGRDKFKELLKAFDEHDFFTLNSSYEEHAVTDLPTITISYLSQYRSLEVNHYHGDPRAPRRLTELENKFDEIVDIESLASDGDIVGKKLGPWARFV